MKRTCCSILLVMGCLLSLGQLHVPAAGLVITTSIKLQNGIYHINNGKTVSAAVIEIAGNNIVVDFNNAVLDGNVNGTLPDKFFGTAVIITGGKNITIKNLRARGYKVALMAKDIEGLVIEHCDFSYNYRQHLNSTQQEEDAGDWMSYHHNEKDEWLRYGAAIYLRGCHKAQVHDNIVTGGQCALMLTQCDSGMVYNNNFSFNSGIGVGMYRSSSNKIIGNKLDFNVRGHSEGVYNRGQDAAAILVFEQCNKNVCAYNSATHSGDGFFLWAGQTTMDSGEGGCNDNLIFKNDFSYAPTNGVEVTFSRNRISTNRIEGCDNGIWGGYSYNTPVIFNDIRDCKMGIAIEHGQDNEIQSNWFKNCGTAVKLWGRATQPADWGYAIKRDTRSRDYLIKQNHFDNNNLVFDFLRTQAITIEVNDTNKNVVFLKRDTSVQILNDTSKNSMHERTPAVEEENISGDIISLKLFYTGDAAFYESGPASMNRGAIRMTAWGPYDFRSPLIWNSNPVDKSDTMKFEIIGPAGNWKLVSQRGVKNISSANGTIPATITAVKTNEKGQDVFIELEYTGEAITTAFGEKITKGKAYRFNYRNALLQLTWGLNCYAFDSLQNPIKNPSLMTDLKKQAPVFTETSTGLNYAWWGGAGTGKKYERFITIATSDIDFPAGNYELGVSWEDAVRIYIDDQLLLDEWKSAATNYDESPHRDLPVKLAGQHHLRVEQANLEGFATLIIKLKKK